MYNFSKKEGKTTEAETKQALKSAKENSENSQSVSAITGINAIETTLDAAAGEKPGTAIPEAPKGGRRLTRKRIFKLKKNRRITRIRPPFKSAAVAVAAFRRK